MKDPFVRGIAYSSSPKAHSSLDSDDESLVSVSSEDSEYLHAKEDWVEHFSKDQIGESLISIFPENVDDLSHQVSII